MEDADVRALRLCRELYCKFVAGFVEHSGVVLFATCKCSIVLIGFDCFVEPDALPWMMGVGEMGTEGVG